MPITRVFIAIVLLFLQGCVSLQPKATNSAYIAKNVRLDFIDLHKIPKQHSLNQLLKGTYKDKTASLNLVTQFHPDHMKSVALTKFGAEVFTLEYDNKNLNFKAAAFTKKIGQIKPEYIFADIQLVYWPVEAIRQNMQGDMMVMEVHNKRIFSKGGKVVIEITYSNKDKWRSNIHYRHLERGYEYSIENL